MYSPITVILMNGAGKPLGKRDVNLLDNEPHMPTQIYTCVQMKPSSVASATRIASPRVRTAKEVHEEKLRFLERFKGKRSECVVDLAKIFGRQETKNKFIDYLTTGELNYDSWGWMAGYVSVLSCRQLLA